MAAGYTSHMTEFTIPGLSEKVANEVADILQ
jgi:hypothetical protein